MTYQFCPRGTSYGRFSGDPPLETSRTFDCRGPWDVINFAAFKALGKLGKIVAETCFLTMFHCLPTSGNIVAETKLATQDAKIFAKKFRNVFVAQTMFPSLLACFQMFPARETLFSRSGKYKKCFKITVQI